MYLCPVRSHRLPRKNPVDHFALLEERVWFRGNFAKASAKFARLSALAAEPEDASRLKSPPTRAHVPGLYLCTSKVAAADRRHNVDGQGNTGYAVGISTEVSESRLEVLRLRGGKSCLRLPAQIGPSAAASRR
jgi:hypothetical protein